ncbi:type II secretory pathway pseudopilin PulG [Pelomonas saccharophila]|uniref:Type II secretory pathway pseudopilin PulG n=1 Tax=Roseateles saccharophilus TaxID=304 RepID=A0ABU1YVL9_ROSSA|nr:type II secretion system protein [Roseateles saccharophilus]MDR7272914.1 type II secretory pathway pseudopilin PulG [Roseateles saccharophilus]
MRRLERGYSYLAVLFLVALTAAGLAALGQAWSTAAQRERERELLFRGGEIARAISAYAKATPNPPEQYPRSLEDLVEDQRSPRPRRHLRRAYEDPFTGKVDWELVPEPGQPGAFSAVRSRSKHALLREYGPDGQPVKQAHDLLFSSRYAAGIPQLPVDPASAASAASGASR